MSQQRPFSIKSLLVLALGLALIGMAKTPKSTPTDLSGRNGDSATGDHATPNGGEHSKRADVASYVVGYGLALALTFAAFALVHWRWASGTTALAVVLGLAFAQALVHFRCFLHVSLKHSARDDLQLILFSTIIICLMVGGTLVVLFNLRLRMM